MEIQIKTDALPTKLNSSYLDLPPESSQFGTLSSTTAGQLAGSFWPCLAPPVGDLSNECANVRKVAFHDVCLHSPRDFFVRIVGDYFNVYHLTRRVDYR